MTEKVRTQILLTPKNYSFVEKEREGRKHTNFSQTINELLYNYQIMIREASNLQEKKAQTAQIQKEASKMIDDFRASMQEAKVIKE